MHERGERNSAILDLWSLVHFLSGVGLGWVMDSFWALVILIMWEPFEIFLLGPLVYKVFGKEFGYESFRNSASDIVMDILGLLAGLYLLRMLIEPPFILFAS